MHSLHIPVTREISGAANIEATDHEATALVKVLAWHTLPKYWPPKFTPSYGIYMLKFSQCLSKKIHMATPLPNEIILG